MTNAEFYKDEIKKFEGINFCDNFIKPIILGGDCREIYCEHCHTLVMLWLMEEHKEPETDWSKVPIDTPILGRDNEREGWTRGHFAELKGGRIGMWAYGGTSFTWKSDKSDDRSIHYWKHAKLWEGSQEQAAEQRKQEAEKE